MALEAATIDPRVPLAQTHTGRRVVALRLGIADDAWSDDAKNLGVDITTQVAGDDREGSKIKAAEYGTMFRDMLRQQGATSADLVGVDEALAILGVQPKAEMALSQIRDVLSEPVELRLLNRITPSSVLLPHAFVDPLTQVLRTRVGVPPPLLADDVPAVADALGRVPAIGAPPPADPIDPGSMPVAPASAPGVPQLADALIALADGRYLLPQLGSAGIIKLKPYVPPKQSNPTLFLIEDHGLTSSLGSFGMGRTTGPFSLFPNETTEIAVKTWLTATETTSEATSIIDSFGTTSADKFNSQLEQTAGRSASIETGSSYSNEWHASGGFSFIVSAEGGGGESRAEQTNIGRSEFAQQTSSAIKEHVSTANANRETSISDSRNSTQTFGNEQTVTRTIRNVNMRHCLNILFRELNQQYITRHHLVGLRIGFQNGKVGSWREAPISQLLPFVSQFVNADTVGPVCTKFLKLANLVTNKDDTPVPVLQRLMWQDDGTLNVADVPGDDKLAPPTNQSFYRFHPGPLGKQDVVDGVVLSETTVIMRTGTLIADALLSPGEALDEYAMARQKADAQAAKFANARTQIDNLAAEVRRSRAAAVVDALKSIPDASERMKAYTAAYRPIVVDGDEVPLDG
jgi:hypothetical protein